MSRRAAVHRVPLLTLAAVALRLPPAYGYEYSGHLNLGAYTARETDRSPSLGASDSRSNDLSSALGSAYLSVTSLGDGQGEMIFDARDQYDAYGRIDANAPRLVADDQPQLRQLSYTWRPGGRDPGDGELTLGRFPAADAAVLDNDGAAVGYYNLPGLKTGAFVGLVPEDRQGMAASPANETRQVGLYTVYQDPSPDWSRNTVAASSLVLRQPAPGTTPSPPSQEAPGIPVDPLTPTHQSDPRPTGSYAFWYLNLMHQPSEATRFVYTSAIDLAKAVRARDLVASAYHRLSPSLSGTISATRLDLTEYERQRDVTDTLPVSVYSEGRIQGRYKLSSTWLLQLDGQDGRRSLDGRTRAEGGLKVVATSLLAGTLSSFVGGGYRKNFLSHDVLTRMGWAVYTPFLELNLDTRYIIERRDDGEVLHPAVATLGASWMASRTVLLALSLEYAQDEHATVASTLFSVGHRFNSRQLTPVRDRAPALERL